MNLQREAFVNAYLTEAQGNGTQAAILAGYSERTAAQIASRLLKDVEIRQAIDAKLEKADLRTQTRLEKLAKIADAHPKDVKASDVVAANKLILQVNGALQQQAQHAGLTVNIGFINQPTSQPIITIDGAMSAEPRALVMSPQALVSAD